VGAGGVARLVVAVNRFAVSPSGDGAADPR